MSLKAEWIDGHREPQCEPDPEHPKGVDVVIPLNNFGQSEARRCSMPLPYPAPRCGLYIVTCEACGQKIGVTTAGRPDDPRSVSIPCDERLQ